MKSLKTNKQSIFLGRFLLTGSMIVLTGDYANAAASISNISFGQLDWYDDNGLLHTADSSWGRMDMTFIPDATDIFYLNVVGNAGNGESWIIQNMPILSADFWENSRQSVDFNIVDLGLSTGTDLLNMDVFFSVDATPLLAEPIGLFNNFLVSDVEQRTTGGFLAPFPIDVGQPAGQKAKGPVTKVIQHKNVPGIQEGHSKCLTGAFGRSISWLNQEYNLGYNKTPQEIYNELFALNIGQGLGDNNYSRMIRDKANYLNGIANNAGTNAVTKLLDIQNIFGNIEGVKKETRTDLINWLYRELPTEDVELDYGHHIVTVTGIYMQDGMTYVKYRDDETQSNDNAGDTEEKRGKLTLKDGMYFFRRDPEKGTPSNDFKVRVTISESVKVPEPTSTLSLLVLGTLGAASTLKRQLKPTKSAEKETTKVG